MKNVSINRLAVILLLLITMATSCSQNLAPLASQTDAPAWPKTEEVIEPVSTDEVSSKVMHVFSKSYGKQQAPNWYRSPKGFSVSFEKEGVKTLVHYTAAGVEAGSMKFYFEKDLTPEVRHTVKSNFYDYAILYVTEVKKNDATTFYIKLQDSTTIKTIRMANEEWEVVESLARL